MFLYINNAIFINLKDISSISVINEYKSKHNIPSIVINFIRGNPPYTLHFPTENEFKNCWENIKESLNMFINQI